jgi:hypothetical protein
MATWPRPSGVATRLSGDTPPVRCPGHSAPVGREPEEELADRCDAVTQRIEVNIRGGVQAPERERHRLIHRLGTLFAGDPERAAAARQVQGSHAKRISWLAATTLGVRAA